MAIEGGSGVPYSFNLISEPFIPCILSNGQRAELSLRDALLRAQEVAEIRDDSPLVTIALHRLLLAILHRCNSGPKNAAERVAIWQSGRFDPARVTAYFDKWHDRFDLFHDSFPFFQRAGFVTKDPSGMNRLAQERSRGNNAALFDHTSDAASPPVTPARAARLVIAEQAFAVGGGKSETGNTTHGPLVSAAVVLAQGKTLFETLWLNLTVFHETDPVPSLPDDAPLWERPPATPHTQPRTPRGYLDYLTWPSRTLRLHVAEHETQIAVTAVSYAQGRALELPPLFFDPMVAYSRKDASEPYRPVRFNEYRELWRESGALFTLREESHGLNRAPTCLHTLTAAKLKGILPGSARHRLSIFGVCTDKAKVNFWRQETLPLPCAFLERPELVERLRQALAFAESVGTALRSAVWAAAKNRLTAAEGGTADTDRVRGVVDSFAPDRWYWSQLERPFGLLMLDIAASGADLDACIDRWYGDSLEMTARRAYDGTIGRMNAGRDLKAVIAGRGKLAVELKKFRDDNHIPSRQKAGAP